MVRHGPTGFAMVQVRHCPICSDICSDMACVRAWVSEVRGRVSGRGLFPLFLRHWMGECQAKKFLRKFLKKFLEWRRTKWATMLAEAFIALTIPLSYWGTPPTTCRQGAGGLGFDHLLADPLPIGRSLTRPHVNHPVQKSIQPRVARFLSGEVGGRGVSL
jgi:hypothetical protein